MAEEVEKKVVGAGEFEKEIRLAANPKVASKYWIARVNGEDLEFLNPLEGSRVKGTYILKNGEFYIALENGSSWKNSRQYYMLYHAVDNDLKMIAEIDFINSRKEFIAIDDDVKEKMKEFYRNETNGRKVINTLIKTARYYAQREGLREIDKKELLKEEITALMKKYEISKEDLLEIVKEVE